MRLDEIASSYDAVIGLGSICQVPYQIKRKKLQRLPSPFDRLFSSRLSDVNFLLQNRFSNFMDYSNLIIEGLVDNETYRVRDKLYNMESYHDFPISPNYKDPLPLYPVFKQKLAVRINNFFNMCNNSSSLLFIRLEASYDEVIELIAVLKTIVKGKFILLIINFSEAPGITEENWQINDVCNIKIQDTISVRWQGCNSTWDKILTGVSLKN